MDWENFLTGIIPPVMTFVLGIITKIIYDNVPFFSKKKQESKVRKCCPDVYFSYTRSSEDIKEFAKNGLFYNVILKTKVDDEQNLRAKLSFEKIPIDEVDAKNKGLITIINHSNMVELLHFKYEKYKDLSLNNFTYSVIEKGIKLTMIFDINELPKGIEIALDNNRCFYNIDKRIGNSSTITPEIVLLRKI